MMLSRHSLYYKCLSFGFILLFKSCLCSIVWDPLMAKVFFGLLWVLIDITPLFIILADLRGLCVKLERACGIKFLGFLLLPPKQEDSIILYTIII